MAPAIAPSDNEVSTTAPGKSAALAPEKSVTAVRKKQAEQCASVFFGILAVLCLILGIWALAWPILNASSIATDPVDFASTQTCQTVDPTTAPQPPAGGADPAYLAEWEQYVSDVTNRPEGLDPGCEPMRFPSTSGTYRGVVIMWHGFSSCTQEMAILGPPIAAQGYDVLIPVMPGHGNALVFEPDGAFWLWGYVTMGISLAVMACLCCCRSCPCCAKKDCMGKACGTTDHGRTMAIRGCAGACSVMLIVSLVAIILTVAGPGVAQCISMSPLAPSCFGHAEENDNLPTTAAGYIRGIERLNGIAALEVTGERVIVGLSGGGGAAAYAAGASAPDGTSALYDRALLLAPYIGLETLEPVVDPARNLGLGKLVVHYGDNCANERREAGKAGYCNIAINNIWAMREVGRAALAEGAHAGTKVQLAGVDLDPVVMNSKILELYDSYVADGVDASFCLFGGDMTGYHSPVSIWNQPDVDMHWVGDLVCRFTSFVADGTFLPEGAEHECVSPCAESNCGWNCTSDSFVTCPWVNPEGSGE